MKKIYSLLIILCLLNLNAQETKKTLFIGNSYTSSNNLPSLIENLAIANGDTFIYDQNTPGGYTLSSHSTNSTTLNKIASENWDYVILQAQSQEPSFSPAQVNSQTKPFAAILNDSIQSNFNCTNTLFYMTWGRENGDASNCAAYPPICTYEGMQQRLKESYLEMANENSASVAPVGVAWKKVRDDFPNIDLYSADGSHPSINGSYLAACVFYSSMYNKTTVGNTYWSSIDSLTTFRLQDIASSTVLNDQSLWYIDTSAYAPSINDSIVSSCDSVLVNETWFYNDTIFSDTISLVALCNFDIINYTIQIANQVEIISFEQGYPEKTNGTGILFTIEVTDNDSIQLYNEDSLEHTFYSISNTVYTYYCTNNSNEEINFKIIAYNQCSIDSQTSLFECSSLSPISEIKNSNWIISPNPTTNIIDIVSKKNDKFYISLVDVTGRTVLEKNEDSLLDLSQLNNGIYYVILYDKNGNKIGQKKVLKK